MTESLRDRLIRHEGLRLSPYKDSLGISSIGIGRNLETNPLPLKMALYLEKNRQITKEMAYDLFDHDIAECEQRVLLQWPWSASLDDVRFGVVLEMVFQMGIKGLSGFRRFLNFMELGDYPSASKEMLKSLWASQTPARAKELAEIVKNG